MTSVIRTDHSEFVVGKMDLTAEEHEFIMELDLPRHPVIRVYNRDCQPKRNTQFYSNEASGYKFSNAETKAAPLPPMLDSLLHKVNIFTGDNFNGILVNVYTSGEDCIGTHSDDESELGTSGVFMIVCGQTRNFRIRYKQSGKIAANVDIPDGSYGWMKGHFQREFKHEIPVEKKRNGRRVSLTFRKHE